MIRPPRPTRLGLGDETVPHSHAKEPAAVGELAVPRPCRTTATTLDSLMRLALHEEVRDAVGEALAELAPAAAPPILVDRRELARRLSISESVLDRLRR